MLGHMKKQRNRGVEQSSHLLADYPPESSQSSTRSFSGSSESSASTLDEKACVPDEVTEVAEALSRPSAQRSSTLTTPERIFSLLLALVPSFLRKGPKSKARKIHPTSWLDGLRGVAALIVYFDHFAVNWFEPLRYGYGSSPGNYYLIQLPIIRLIYCGRASVGVFFVISGFVLTYKPLRQIRARQYSRLLDTLASSVFRRAMRLYFPIAAGTFVSMLMAFQGLFHPVPSGLETIPPVYEKFSEQIAHWYDHMIGITFPFTPVDPNHPYSPPYNGHLWTIPIEFYGSIVVFVTILGLSRCKTVLRIGILIFSTFWTLKYQRWDLSLFLAGVLIAEFTLMSCESSSSLPTAEHESLNSPSRSKASRTVFHPWIRTVILFSSIFLALFTLSYAGDGASPGIFFVSLQSLTPSSYHEIWYGPERFWLALGSVLLILTLTLSPTLQRPFTTRFSQYMGEISYSLYIVHGLILFTMGTRLQAKWTQVSRLVEAGDGSGPTIELETVKSVEYMWAFAKCVVLNTIAVIWAADVFWRLVDNNSVTLARKIGNFAWEKATATV